ncbi:MAG: V-type ATP synthase subunit E [Clostridium argentinense]|uniref:V-type proton ATPase subunit E n=1 Tax=Clostridium faecium TaxID=2762223 RepID=A0ABR8YQT6_9CLOT|nr:MULTISPECIES: V-type ATP synthase subunit E [Clostridium]MBD8046615.1 V-type ATP synthase subunit E [Clostridium faecium]MBS5824933.1 V-type ATP synthase subunit E [Clostridium argentinense]MDU1348696.1 V-type ATP synthase subunit E [Clostridium argentinense]
MSNLENLTSKIVNDAKEKAEGIVNDAKVKEKEIIAKKKDEAEKIAKDILEKANLEGKNLFDRAISKNELKVRNEKLVAKQQIIDKVFNEAIKELSNMSQEDYLNYIRNNLKSMKLQGHEEIIVSENDKNKISEEFINELNNAIAKDVERANIILSKETRPISGGFILTRSGIEFNFSYDALVNSLRYEIENDVAMMLFN